MHPLTHSHLILSIIDHEETVMKSFLSMLAVMLASGMTVESRAGEGVLATKQYGDYEKPEFCGSSCHIDFYQQWTQAMMSQAYTHHWDEIEYFKLAVPHAEKDPKVAEVKAGCNGCHTPMAFLAGDVPPPKPSENSRANEAVSCDVCHTITGMTGDTPFNFNYVSDPGPVKYGPREGMASPVHETKKSAFMQTAEFCGICHNEKSPYGVWVKSTHLEWKEGPYADQGVTCHYCHMTRAPGQVATVAEAVPDARQHLFHGAHDPGKVRGTIELRVHPDVREVEPGLPVLFTVALFNQKTGHKFPTGSAEERLVWLHVEAKDAKGKVYHLPVDPKGFEGEEYMIAANTLAYQDMGIPLGIPDFPGIQRDGVPPGDRIYRLPYFDPQGRMTIMQWNTASQGPDYRIGPRETKIEHFTWTVPPDCPPGQLIVKAVLNYQKLPRPVAEYLGVPIEEAEVIEVNSHSTMIEVLP
jgi:Cytochrome c554 and c-prime